MDFNDRRPCASPCEDDWSTPLSRETLVDANARLRGATPQYRLGDRNRSISTLAVQRHRSREAGQGDFSSIGEYLEFLAGAQGQAG
jgi:hypothetical protein